MVNGGYPKNSFLNVELKKVVNMSLFDPWVLLFFDTRVNGYEKNYDKRSCDKMSDKFTFNIMFQALKNNTYMNLSWDLL